MRNTRPLLVFNLTLGVASVLILVVSVVLARETGLKVAFGPVAKIAGVLVFLACGAFLYHWRQADRLRDVFLFTFWAVLLTNLYVVPMYAAGRQRTDLCDAQLAAIDRAIGLEVPTILSAIQRVSWLAPALSVCYDLLVPLMALAFILPPLLGKVQVGKEYLLACLVAAILSIPLFALVQAEGSWTVHGYAVEARHQGYVDVFAALRGDGEVLLELGRHEGIITFPSFHCILALLAGVALWPIPYLRWPAAALAGLITLSTVTAGGHYVIDVIGGVVVTGVSVAAARAFTWIEGWPGPVAEPAAEAGRPSADGSPAPAVAPA